MMIRHLLWAFLVYKVSTQSCDESGGWYELSGDCYRVSRSPPETQFTWQEARESCMAEGGDLASIHSQAELDFILQLSENVGLTGTFLWIGMNHIEDRSGAFSWVDGSATAWTNWATSQPAQGGLTMCAYMDTDTGPGPFVLYPYNSALYGIINPDYDYPSYADGVNTFYFGQNYGWTYAQCQDMCEQHPIPCAAATFWEYHYNYYWDHVCMGRSDFVNILGPDNYAHSGIRSMDSGETRGWWYSGNCGLNHGVACRKVMGSDNPVTIPPTPVIDSYCPSGYFSADREEGNKCFRIVEIPTETQGFRWEQAVLLCRTGPGHRPDIATIQTEEEAMLLSSKIQKYGWGFWIGLHYSGVHNKWVWADNQEGSYYNWAPGQPSTINPCVEMYTLSGPSGQWGSQVCDQGRGYVCQTYKDADNIVPTPAITTPHTCEAGWTPYWYACYQFQSEARTWSAARDYCAGQGGALVSIHTEAENAAVFYGANGNLPLWLGLQKNQTSGKYIWVDGWDTYYTNFDDGGDSNGEGCVVMKANRLWNDTQCSATYPSVCKQTDQPPPTADAPDGGYCPIGWEKFGFNCYYFSGTSDDYTGALTDCRVRGSSINAELVTIENEAENHFIYSRLDKSATNVVSSWIGLYRNPSAGGNHTWVDGSTSPYRRWAPGEPGFELCSEMDINFINTFPSSWYDYDCNTQNHYVCKGDQGPAPTYPTVPTAAPGECPSSEWLPQGSDCLLIRPNVHLSWEGAAETCRYITGGRGSLAHILTIEENQFILFWADYLTDTNQYPLPSVWIGMSKEGFGHPYLWESGVVSTWTRWGPGEPNDVDGSQNCVRMYIFVTGTEGMWDDYYCHDNTGHGYVCRTAQGTYADLDIDEANFVPEAEKNRKRNRTLQVQDVKPDLLIEDALPQKDMSEIVVGSVLGLVGLCVISVAIVFMVQKRRQKRRQEQEPSFENPLSNEVASDVEQQENTRL